MTGNPSRSAGIRISGLDANSLLGPGSGNVAGKRLLAKSEIKKALFVISRERLGISNPGFEQFVEHVETNRLVVLRARLAQRGPVGRPPTERGKISTFASQRGLSHRDGRHIYMGRLQRSPRVKGSNSDIDISIRSIDRNISTAVRDIEVLLRNLSSSLNSKGGR